MAGLIRKGFASDNRGISDILSIAFMFLMVIFAGVLLHAYRSDAISSATDRQLQMKAEYLYRTLELAHVENYSLSYFEAVAENLIKVTEPIVPGDYLRGRIDNLLAYLCPPNYAVTVKLTYENDNWTQLYPSGMGEPAPTVTQFTFSGKVTLVIAEAASENRVAQVDAMLTLFKS
jgi:hypothetical protein